jgi:hypothetical protein
MAQVLSIKKYKADSAGAILQGPTPYAAEI